MSEQEMTPEEEADLERRALAQAASACVAEHDAKKASMTVTVTFDDIKSPDTWGEVIHALSLSESESDRFFDYGEYASIELTIAADMTFTGRVLEKP